MTRRLQKITERQIATGYQELRGLQGTLCDGPEPPDFLLTTPSGKIIEIEVTEYNQPITTDERFTKREVEARWHSIREYVVEFRRTCRELDNLSVWLEFLSLRLPAKQQTASFVASVAEIVSRELSNIDEEHRYHNTQPSWPKIAQQYLRSVRVRKVRCYMEWDWNFSIGAIGTSDLELRSILQSKQYSCLDDPAPNYRVLVIKGDGPSIAQIMAPMSVAQLNDFSELTLALTNGQFDEVAILSLTDFLWTRRAGWGYFESNTNALD